MEGREEKRALNWKTLIVFCTYAKAGSGPPFLTFFTPKETLRTVLSADRASDSVLLFGIDCWIMEKVGLLKR